jgi:tetrahydromethanopterin S-methyltransferase subunit A
MQDFGFFLSRVFATTKARKAAWPYVPGKYFVTDPDAPVAVATLGSAELAATLADAEIAGLCISGKVEPENIGIEKVIKNVLSNPAIRFLICAGPEPPKHLTGATMVALFANGVDEARRIVGAPGMRPVLRNTDAAEVAAFRDRVTPIDMIGCSDISQISARVKDLAARAADLAPLPPPATTPPVRQSDVEHVMAVGTDPKYIKLDKTGYFVIHVSDGSIVAEHYSNKDELLRVVEGSDARGIYLTLIRNGWVSRLDHAAYLGRELSRAELAGTGHQEYIQDGA